jgi:hypothetical protein
MLSHISLVEYTNTVHFTHYHATHIHTHTRTDCMGSDLANEMPTIPFLVFGHQNHSENNGKNYVVINQLNALSYILLYFSFTMDPTCFGKTMPSSGSDYVPF